MTATGSVIGSGLTLSGVRVAAVPGVSALLAGPPSLTWLAATAVVGGLGAGVVATAALLDHMRVRRSGDVLPRYTTSAAPAA